VRTFLALLALTATGCFHMHYVTERQPAPAPTSETWHNGFVFGLVEGSPLEVGKVCPSGVARIDSTETFVNGLVHVITWSIYTPETVTVTCSAADAPKVPQSPTRPWK
jgi:hypothetical protein